MKLHCCLRLFMFFSLELFFPFSSEFVYCTVRKWAGFWAVSAQWKMLSLYLKQENTLCHVTQAWQQVTQSKWKFKQPRISSGSVVFWFVLSCNITFLFLFASLKCDCLQTKWAHWGGSGSAKARCSVWLLWCLGAAGLGAEQMGVWHTDHPNKLS